MIFPFDLDIFCPSESLTRPWIKTFLNGGSFRNFSEIIIILATQKNIMSNPVTNIEEG